MEENSNLKIVQRLLELSKNTLDYSVHPQEFKKEYIFLANVLNDSLDRLRHEFADAFKQIVGQYKNSLKEGKGYGWFHSPEKLEWIQTYINQLDYAVYGEKFTRQLKFKSELKNKAYKNFIEQIDRTVLMTPTQLKKHNAQCNKIAKEIMDEILAEEKKQKANYEKKH